MPKEATAKQIAFAEKISYKLKIEKPKNEYEIVNEFIDKHKDTYLTAVGTKKNEKLPYEEPPPKEEQLREIEKVYEVVNDSEQSLYRLRKKIADREQQEKQKVAEYYKTEQGQIELAYIFFTWWQGCIYGSWYDDMTVSEQSRRFKRFLNDDTEYKDDENFNKQRALFKGEEAERRKRLIYEIIKQKGGAK